MESASLPEADSKRTFHDFREVPTTDSCTAVMTVYSITRREWDPSLFRDVHQIVHNRSQQRNPAFASFRFSVSLGVTGNQRTPGARSRFCVAKHPNPLIDLFFEFVLVDEAIDLHCAEEVTDALADAAFGHVLPECKGRREGAPIGTAQHAAQHVDHHGEAISLVAARIAFGA